MADLTIDAQIAHIFANAAKPSDPGLSCYGTPVERYDDGSRELTKAERIEQIGWEIAREEAERTANLADAKAEEINARAGMPNHVAQCYRWAEECNERIESLRHELNNLRPNAPKTNTGTSHDGQANHDPDAEAVVGRLAGGAAVG